MKPSKEELENLYIIQRLTTRQIGEIYSVSKTEVLRWMRKYSIERRANGRGLIHRGITEPTQEELFEMVHQKYLNYGQIASFYGVDGTAVMHWLRKHHITPLSIWESRKNGVIPIKPDLNKIKGLYEEGMPVSYLSLVFSAGTCYINKWLKEAGCTLKKQGFQGACQISCNDGHRVSSWYERIVDDWLYENGIPHIVEPPLPFGSRYRADFLANGYYIEIWGVENKKYEARKAYKLTQYQIHNLRVIEIHPHHFHPASDSQFHHVLVNHLLT